MRYPILRNVKNCVILMCCSIKIGCQLVFQAKIFTIELGPQETKENIFAYGRVPMLFTFQHEVAHRMIAPPGDPQRSRLSVVCQNYAQAWLPDGYSPI